MLRRRGPALALTFALVAAPGAGAARARPRCFDVVVEKNSRGTSAVFAERHCQGGGVTWAAILRALARRPANGGAAFTVDESGDVARFCAEDRRLVATVRRQYERANSDAAALQRAMTEARAEELECADGAKTPGERLAEVSEMRSKLDRLDAEIGIHHEGPVGEPGTSPEDLAVRWARTLSDGNQRGLVGLISHVVAERCAGAARAAEDARRSQLAQSLGALMVTVPRGVKLERAEALGAARAVEAGAGVDGCPAPVDLTLQRWRFHLRAPDGQAHAEDYEVVAARGRWALRAR